MFILGNFFYMSKDHEKKKKENIKKSLAVFEINFYTFCFKETAL